VPEVRHSETQEAPAEDGGAWSISKDAINSLPLRSYAGPVEVVRTEAQLAAALHALRGESPLGFDTETRPAFRRGESYSPSLLQIASSREVFLFQLKPLGRAAGLRALLGDPSVLKAGVAVTYDVLKLREILPFEPAGFLEIETLARAMSIRNGGLRSLAALLLGFRISKAAQTSRWDSDRLTPTQVAYAATDAWASREVFLKLAELNALAGNPPPQPILFVPDEAM